MRSCRLPKAQEHIHCPPVSRLMAGLANGERDHPPTLLSTALAHWHAQRTRSLPVRRISASGPFTCRKSTSPRWLRSPRWNSRWPAVIPLTCHWLPTRRRKAIVASRHADGGRPMLSSVAPVAGRIAWPSEAGWRTKTRRFVTNLWPPCRTAALSGQRVAPPQSFRFPCCTVLQLHLPPAPFD